MKRMLRDFFSRLDQKFEGNKLYDWYWWNIWSNIWKVCYAIPRDKCLQHKYNKQRIADGVSDQDCWSIPDWLLETMYNALGKFLLAEYGEEPVDWKEHTCKTHNKRLYDQIVAFRSEYEHLLDIRERVAIFDIGGDSDEVWYPEYKSMVDREYEIYQTCIYLLTNLLSKNLENLWW